MQCMLKEGSSSSSQDLTVWHSLQYGGKDTFHLQHFPELSVKHNYTTTLATIRKQCGAIDQGFI